MMNIFLLLNIHQERILQIILGCIFGSQQKWFLCREQNYQHLQITQTKNYQNNSQITKEFTKENLKN